MKSFVCPHYQTDPVYSSACHGYIYFNLTQMQYRGRHYPTQEMAGRSNPSEPTPTIDVNHLSYTFKDGPPGLVDVCLSLPAGSRTLLIGGKHV